MKRPNIKWTIILITILVTIAVLNGGQAFWHRYAVEKPLSQALQSIKGVESFYWENSAADDTMRLHVTLGNVDTFKTAYQNINDSAAHILGQKKYSIIIHDHRTPELEQLYDSIELYIQEAIFTGNFSAMAEHIQQKAAASGAAVHISVDEKYVYLDLRQDASTMYVTILRQHFQEVK